MAGPDFTDLGVKNPTTGQPVYLSAGEISQVMGATGGVAPSPIAAGIGGLVKGAQIGEQLVSGFETIKNQAAVGQGIDLQNQQRALQLQTQQQTQAGQVLAENNQNQQRALQLQTQQQTQAGQVLAENNQNQQAALAASAQVDHQQNIASVLSALYSGDPTQINSMLGNPKLLPAAIENDKFVQAAITRAQNSGIPLPPDFQKNLDLYSRTRDIVNAGPLADQYQQAARGATQSLAFQQLQGLGGYDTNQLLQGMRVMQQGYDIGGNTRNLLVGPDGKAVQITDSKELESLGGFFGARQQLASGGKYALPTPGATSSLQPVQPQLQNQSGQTIQAQAQQVAQAAGLPVNPAATPDVPNNQQTATSLSTPSVGTTAVPPSNATAAQVQTPGIQRTAVPGQVIANGMQTQWPPGVLPYYTGQANNSDAAAYNSYTTTYKRVFSATGDDKKAQELALQAAKEQLDLGKTVAINDAKEAAKINENVGQLRTTAQQWGIAATQIDHALADAKQTNYPLGGSVTDWLAQGIVGTGITQSLEEVNNAVANRLKYAGSLAIINTVEELKLEAGVGVKMFDSDSEKKLLQQSGPSVSQSPEMLSQISALYHAKEDKLNDTDTIIHTVVANGGTLEQATALAKEYQSSTPYTILNEETGYLQRNLNRPAPGNWTLEKLGVNQKAQLDSVITSTQIVEPQAQPAQKTAPEAPASGSANPLGTPSPDQASPMPKPETPAPTPEASTRPIAFNQKQNSSPATFQDLQTMVQTIKKGGDLKQFQSAGALPQKMDRATPDLIARVIHAESGGKVNALSSAGAEGLMQIEPATGQQVANQLHLGSYDGKNPTTNLKVGMTYLNQRLEARHGNLDLALADYNAGLRHVNNALDETHLTDKTATIDDIAPSLPQPDVTRNYVKQIVGEQPIQKKAGIIDQLNPFAASEAQAEDLTPADLQAKREKDAQQEAGKEPVTFDEQGRPIVSIGPTHVPSTVAQPEATLSAPAPAQESPKGTPPPAEIDAKTPRAQSWLKTSALGKWMGGIANETMQTTPFKFAEAAANSFTAGWYDELASKFAEMVGGDPNEVMKGYAQGQAELQKDHPYAKNTAEVLGFVGAQLGATKLLQGVGIIAKGAEAAAAAEKAGAARKIVTSAAENAGYGGVRGAGENTDNRALGAASGTVIGGALGAVAGGLGAAPVVGGTAALGAGVGMFSDPQNPLKGAAEGAGVGTVAGIVRATPVVQKVLGIALTKLNHYYGVNTLNSLSAKLLTGKDLSELVSSLNPTELKLASILSFETPAALEKMLQDVKGDPNSRILDKLNNDEITTLIKTIRQVGGDATRWASGQLKKFADSRVAQGAQEGRLADILGQVSPEQSVETTARELINKATSVRIGIQKDASDAARAAYADAFAQTPTLESPELTRLFHKAGVKDAKNEARQAPDLRNLKSPFSDKMVSRAASDVVEAVKSGEDAQPILKQIEDNQFAGTFESGKGGLPDPAEAMPSTYVRTKKLGPVKGEAPAVQNTQGSTTVSQKSLPGSTEVLAGGEEAGVATNERVTQTEGNAASPEGAAQTLEGDFTKTTQESKQRPGIKGRAPGRQLEFADNSIEVLHRTLDRLYALSKAAYEGAKLAGKQPDTRTGKEYADLAKQLKTELYRLNPALEKADKLYAEEIAARDTLTTKQMRAIYHLADGNVEKGVDDFLAMPDTELAKARDLLGSDNIRAVVRGYFDRAIEAAKKDGDLSKNLLTNKTIRKLNVLIGEQDTSAIVKKIEGEQQLMKTARSLGGGSDTVPKAGAAQTIAEMTGEGQTPANIGNIAVRASLKSSIASAITKVIHSIGDKPDSVLVNDLVDTVVLNREKGIKSLENIINASKLATQSKEAIKTILPELQGLLHASGHAEVTSIAGNAQKRSKK